METGIAYYDDRLKQGKGYIPEMTPKEYLLRCAFQIFPEGTIESIVLSCNNSNINTNQNENIKTDFNKIKYTLSQGCSKKKIKLNELLFLKYCTGCSFTKTI